MIQYCVEEYVNYANETLLHIKRVKSNGLKVLLCRMSVINSSYFRGEHERMTVACLCFKKVNGDSQSVTVKGSLDFQEKLFFNIKLKLIELGVLTEGFMDFEFKHKVALRHGSFGFKKKTASKAR